MIITMGSGKGQIRRTLGLVKRPWEKPTIRIDGTKVWRDKQGERHREGRPAVEGPDGDTEWYSHGELHREDGPAQERSSGYKAWYQYGALHCAGGPAIVQPTGTLEWYIEGRRHREAGPAVIYPNGDRMWWLDGEALTEDEFNEKLRDKRRVANSAAAHQEIADGLKKVTF